MHGTITWEQAGEFINHTQNYRKASFTCRGRVVGVKWYPDEIIISCGCWWNKTIKRYDNPRCCVYDKALTIGDITVYAS